MKVFLCLLGVVLGAVVGASQGQSPLKVAHCRANCIQEFSGVEGGVDCPQAVDCHSCWEECEQLGSGRSGGSCDVNSACGVGCRLACHFHQQLAVQRPPVSVTSGREVILLSGDFASWPPPITTTHNSPHVFVLMCRRQDNSWVQVAQTLQLGWRLPSIHTCEAIRVMVVGIHGLVTVYSPAPEPLQDAGLILRSVGKDIWSLQENILKDSGKETRQDGSWSLREVSLIHQGVLVIAEVSWEAQSTTVYLVTWELAGGGLKGHLLTDSTSVTLSLWPDTVYRIQVQEVRDSQRMSEPLELDTRRATPLPVIPSAGHPLALGHPGFEGVAGVAAALLLFLAVVLALSSWRFSSRPPPRPKEADRLHESDHFKLFPPPVRLLVQPPFLDSSIPEQTCPTASILSI